MHYWGDDWPYWDDLYAAENYIMNYVNKWSRCNVIMKEKWGGLRYSYVWPPGVRYCNCFRIKIPFITKTNRFIEGKRPVYWHWQFSWMCRAWERCGTRCLIRAVRNACKKWPQCANEIKGDLEQLLDRKI